MKIISKVIPKTIRADSRDELVQLVFLDALSFLQNSRSAQRNFLRKKYSLRKTPPLYHPSSSEKMLLRRFVEEAMGMVPEEQFNYSSFQLAQKVLGHYYYPFILSSSE